MFCLAIMPREFLIIQSLRPALFPGAPPSQTTGFLASMSPLQLAPIFAPCPCTTSRRAPASAFVNASNATAELSPCSAPRLNQARQPDPVTTLHPTTAQIEPVGKTTLASPTFNRNRL